MCAGVNITLMHELILVNNLRSLQNLQSQTRRLVSPLPSHHCSSHSDPESQNHLIRFLLLNLIYSRVAISGAGGGLGHLGIQFSHALGYRTVAIDNRDSSISLIESLNCADLIVDARKQSTQEVFKKCNNGLGVDAVLILPESQKAFDYAAPLARKAGTVCIVSFPVDGFKISSHEIVFRDVRIRGWNPFPQKSLVPVLKKRDH